MLTLVDTFVPGRPKTKGSLDFLGQPCRCSPKCKAYLRGHVREGVVGSKQWLALVAKQCAHDRALQWEAQCLRALSRGDFIDMATIWSGPVEVGLVFALPVADAIAVRSGDVDKLARNVLDALTRAKVYEDDVQVVRLLAEKCPAGPRGPGVYGRVKTYVDGE